MSRQYRWRTWGREDTFYTGPETTHVSAADPYCSDLRRLLVETKVGLAPGVAFGAGGEESPSRSFSSEPGVITYGWCV